MWPWFLQGPLCIGSSPRPRYHQRNLLDGPMQNFSASGMVGAVGSGTHGKSEFKLCCKDYHWLATRCQIEFSPFWQRFPRMSVSPSLTWCTTCQMPSDLEPFPLSIKLIRLGSMMADRAFWGSPSLRPRYSNRNNAESYTDREDGQWRSGYLWRLPRRFDKNHLPQSFRNRWCCLDASWPLQRRLLKATRHRRWVGALQDAEIYCIYPIREIGRKLRMCTYIHCPDV